MALSSAHGEGRIHGARSVEQITRDAQDYDYDASISLKKWLRSASTILRQAEIYESEGNDEMTFFLLFRHAHLVLSNLTVHPEARRELYKAAVKEQEDVVRQNLKRLEALKPRINRRYQRYREILREREARKSVSGSAGGGQRRSSAHGPLFDEPFQTLEPREHGEVAVRLAQKEARKRAGRYTYEDEAKKRGGGVWDVRSYQDDVKDDLSQRMQDVRARVDNPHDHAQSRTAQSSVDSRTSSYSYPTVPSKSALSRPWESTTTTQFQSEPDYAAPPIRPPKYVAQEETTRSLPPSIPSKTPLKGPSPPPKTTTPPPSTYRFKTAATTESGVPLRTLFLPPNLRHEFLRIADTNTHKNLETCGILAGSLISNALIISHLIIPSQNSTTDTCEMEDESALFDFVDQQDLMVFGWIHTHPTQTCFMSSRDLHTQSGYQVMLPESIAIVCAPSQNTQDQSDGDGDWGCFRLTDPPGLKHVLGCTQQGLFHPHDIQNIYTGALRPGHVVEARGLEFRVVDLRGGK